MTEPRPSCDACKREPALACGKCAAWHLREMKAWDAETLSKPLSAVAK